MIDGEIITEGEMKKAREQAEVLQTVINQKPSLKGALEPARKLLEDIGYKSWR